MCVGDVGPARRRAPCRVARAGRQARHAARRATSPPRRRAAGRGRVRWARPKARRQISATRPTDIRAPEPSTGRARRRRRPRPRWHRRGRPPRRWSPLAAGSRAARRSRPRSSPRRTRRRGACHPASSRSGSGPGGDGGARRRHGPRPVRGRRGRGRHRPRDPWPAAEPGEPSSARSGAVERDGVRRQGVGPAGRGRGRGHRSLLAGRASAASGPCGVCRRVPEGLRPGAPSLTPRCDIEATAVAPGRTHGCRADGRAWRQRCPRARSAERSAPAAV